MADYTYTFNPKEGLVESISEVDIIYPDIVVSKGKKWNNYTTVKIYDSEGVVVEEGGTISVTEDGKGGSIAHITITNPVTEAGEYTLIIPAERILYVSDSDSDTYIYNDEINARYDIPVIPLTDLDGYVTGSAYVTPAEGSGDGVVSVTADEDNEGLDRSGVVTFHTTKGEPTISVARTIVQEGLREPFAGNDGDFIVADGGTFHVLK